MSPLLALRAIVVLVVAAALFFGGRSCGLAANADAVTKLEREKAGVRVADALAVAEAANEQAATYKRRAEANDAIATQYLEALNHANDKADRLAGDLRTGDLRFRKLWAQCQAVPAAGGDAARSGTPDAEAADREESAGRIVRAAAECDAQVIGLQDVVKAMQEKGAKP